MLFSLVDPETREALVFPVAPESMKVQIDTKIMQFNPISLGSVELPRGRYPIKFTLNGIFPGDNQPFPRLESDYRPNDIIAKFREWSEVKGSTGKELRFIVTETDWNLPVLFNSFAPDYSGGGGITYSMELTEYRSFTVKEIKPQSVPKETVRKKEPSPKTYTIKRGDTLWGIARKMTGSGAKFRELWNLNRKNLRSGNPDLIYPGERLTIPPGWLK